MQLKQKIKHALFQDSVWIKCLLFLWNYNPLNNRYRVKNNRLIIAQAILRSCRITLRGTGNAIEIANGCRLSGLSILITGNNNRIVLGEGITGDSVEICVEDNGNQVLIGKGTKFAGKIHLACTESTQILIGEDCLFSSNIVIRTGDSHSIVDMKGNRINHAKSVEIGNHVWVGHRVLINKGAMIAENSIVGTGAIVTKQFNESNVVVAGIPAKIVKCGVSWDLERM